MRPPLLRWLSLRVRIVLVATLLIGSLLPPFVPRAALSSEEFAVVSPQFLFVEDGFLMKSSTLGRQGERMAYGEGIIHKVKPGEGIDSIAKRYGISVETVRWANRLPAGAALQPDQELIVLPVDGVLHTVRRGQTLARIAQLYDISEEEIGRQNRLRGGFIVAGQLLIIPGGKPIVASTTVASAQEAPLRFAESLTQRDIRLRLQEQDARHREAIKDAPTVRSAPLAGLEATNGILQMPCNGCFFTQYYHPGHYAVDIQTRGGGPIFAAEAGVVIRSEDSGWNGGYGKVIEVDHGNGLITLYGHNRDVYVQAGESVARGQLIGWMGNTGLVYGATGIHIHFEVRVNGVKKNPMLYLQ